MLTARAHAELSCDQPLVNFGEVKAGKPLSHRFTFVNRGSDIVQVTAVQPSCGCLTPRFGERRLRPGDVSVLMLEINTLTAPPGPNAWRAQILYTCGGETHDLTVSLRANVLAEITVQPAALVLQTERSIGHEIRLVDSRKIPFTVSCVRTSSPHVSGALVDAHVDEEGKKSSTIRVEVTAAMPAGRHDEMLQIFTSDPEYPELKVPVTVVKKSPTSVRATPGEVSFQAAAGPLPAKMVLLRGMEDQDIDIARVDSDDPAINCTYAKGPGRMATLRIKVDPSRVTAGGLRSALHVFLTRPDAVLIDIPVSCSGK
jgi:hypothetical protein